MRPNSHAFSNERCAHYSLHSPFALSLPLHWSAKQCNWIEYYSCSASEKFFHESHPMLSIPFWIVGPVFTSFTSIKFQSLISIIFSTPFYFPSIIIQIIMVRIAHGDILNSISQVLIMAEGENTYFECNENEICTQFWVFLNSLAKICDFMSLA